MNLALRLVLGALLLASFVDARPATAQAEAARTFRFDIPPGPMDGALSRLAQVSGAQTFNGGDIDIVAPGGRLLIGSTGAPAVLLDRFGNILVGPSQQGILTFRTGNINIFADRETLLAQSRVFTQQGGNILMWSSNGDINAGKGAKTTFEKGPLPIGCTIDFYCSVNPIGTITGAGIGVLQTVADAPTGDAVLVAPRGTVDAGDAGIRVTGDLFVAAQNVANADNIQVEGEAIGLPQIVEVNTGALTAASAASTAVVAAAVEAADRSRARPVRDIPSIITSRFLGFGE